MRRGMVLGVGAALTAFAGCSLLVDTGGLAGAPADAGADGAHARDGAADAAVDAAPGDAAPRDTGASDADAGPSDAGADVVPYCQRAAHHFCDDFDESTDPRAGWGDDAVSDGGALSLTGDFVSPPRGLYATLAAEPGYNAAAVDSFGLGVASALTLHLAVKIEQLDPNADLSFAFAGFIPTGGDQHAMRVFVSTGSTRLDEEIFDATGDHYPAQHDFGRLFPVGSWTDVVIAVSSQGTYSFVVNGEKWADAQPLGAPGWAAGNAVAGVGVWYSAGPTTGQRVHVDDVSVDFD